MRNQVYLNCLSGLATLLICTNYVAATPTGPDSPQVPFLAAVSVSGRPKVIQILGQKATICPDRFPGGFSILCEPGFWARFGKFTVNWEYVRTEYHLPFFIAGNYNQDIIPWAHPADPADIRCIMDDGVVVNSVVTFKC